jgi:hypothetical protein
MTFPDDTLLAYVDRELDAELAAAIEAAAARDPQLAERIERQRALRKAVHAAYAPVLEEPLPKRLLDLASGTPTAPPEPARRWTWLEWSAIAASLALGVAIGAAWLRESTSAADLVASGSLATALSRQLASEQPADAPIRIGVSFVSRDGSYCRTFTRAKGAQAGLACNDAGAWRLEVIAVGAAQAGEYRTAGAQLPAAVLRAVEERMQGTTLDAAAEKAAKESGWRR